MSVPTQPIRDEHRELLPEVEKLRRAGDAAGTPAMQAAMDDAVTFLRHHLIPHAQAEDAALYPVVAKAMGAPGATATMVRDHVEVARLTERLEWLATALRANETVEVEEVRRLAYGLHAIVRLHFAKEEEVYLPLLDGALSEAEAAEMFEQMEHEAGQAKALAGAR